MFLWVCLYLMEIACLFFSFKQMIGPVAGSGLPSMFPTPVWLLETLPCHLGLACVCVCDPLSSVGPGQWSLSECKSQSHCHAVLDQICNEQFGDEPKCNRPLCGATLFNFLPSAVPLTISDSLKSSFAVLQPEIQDFGSLAMLGASCDCPELSSGRPERSSGDEDSPSCS